MLDDNVELNDRGPDLCERGSSFSLAFIDTTRDLINKFRNQRELNKSNQFSKIMAIAWIMTFAGIGGFCVDVAFYYSIPYYRSNLSIFSRIFSSFCTVFANCGYILFSTVPLDILDIDIVVTTSADYKWVRYLICLVGTIMSIATAVVPPHFAIINIILALSLIYPDNEKSYFWNRFTFKVSMWYIVYIFGLFVMNGYFLYASINGINIFEGGLAAITFPLGKPFIGMYYCTTTFFFLSSIAFIWYWINQRNLYFTSQFELGAGPTLLVYISIYLWNTIFGASLIIQGVWLLAFSNFSNVSNFDCLGMGISALVVGLGLLLPPLVVIIVGRKEIFNIMSKRFDSDSSILEKMVLL